MVTYDSSLDDKLVGMRRDFTCALRESQLFTVLVATVTVHLYTDCTDCTGHQQCHFLLLLGWLRLGSNKYKALNVMI